MIANRYLLAPNSAFDAAHNLLLHGITSEYLHRYLELAAQQAHSTGDSSEDNSGEGDSEGGDSERNDSGSDKTAIAPDASTVAVSAGGTS